LVATISRYELALVTALQLNAGGARTVVAALAGVNKAGARSVVSVVKLRGSPLMVPPPFMATAR
jgi:hypothetical protein